MRKAQSSFEYILLVGVVMLLIVPGAIVFYNYSKRSNEDLARATIYRIGSDLTDSVQKVYYFGESSWETSRFVVPDSVRKIYIQDGSELVIQYDSWGAMSEAVFFSDINMSAPDDIVTNHSGLNLIKVTSKGSHVTLNETQ